MRLKLQKCCICGDTYKKRDSRFCPKCYDKIHKVIEKYESKLQQQGKE